MQKVGEVTVFSNTGVGFFLDIVWPWFKVRWIALIWENILGTQNTTITCVENFLRGSEVKNFAKNSQNDKIFWRLSTLHFDKIDKSAFFFIEKANKDKSVWESKWDSTSKFYSDIGAHDV